MSVSTLPSSAAARPAPITASVADVATLPSKHTGLLMAAVMGISICQFLDLTIANVALPHMRTSLGASMESISWVLTSFIIAGVLVLPLTGWLSDRLGSRNLFLGASVVFVIASMLCGAATSLEEMVVFRAIQGMASAFIGPLSQTIMFDINRPSKQANAMSIWGMVVMIAPISGPFLGGYLTETLNWRWVFYVNLPVGIPALALLWWLLPSRPVVRRRLDVFGAVMLGLGLCGLQLMLDRGQNNDWFESRETVVELLFALSCFWVFIVHTRSVDHPLFEGAMVRDPNFLAALGFMAVLGVTNVALSSVLPTMYQNVYGYDVIDTGMLMAPRGCGVLLTMLITNRLMGKVDTRILISAGYLVAAASMWTMTRWSLDMGAQQIVVSAFIQGLGLGFVFVPINLIAFSTLLPRHRTDGTTLMTLFRNLGSSFGISVIVTTLARNMQTSHADIAGAVTSYNLPVDPASTAAQLGSIGEAAMAMLNGEVTRQAAMIAYLDNFYMLFWLLLAIVPLPWLLKRPGGAIRQEAVHVD
ncbi:MDR family MFS transporter [Sphingomonas sp. SUN039]|uniref:MDR family MFS transporter n=1 Tax=Sphingomonas sp. SUN039 TaxID=2937787 RepID=UPI002164B5CB|nr:MDR family MFS transporter [Sphingomonas sp. SUN039]UVO52665.1 multidrug efflux MFS transporter [Sphingomonas sp. SUN039]